MAPPHQETRRDRLRRELEHEVVQIARSQLAERGRAGVSWRGLARQVGMNPASLYTYFDNLDDVFTAVILDSFQRLGAALQSTSAASAGDPPAERLIALALTYRRWALDHPAEFNLVFTDQIPGYAAPPDGPTVDAQATIFDPFIHAISELTGEHFDPAHPSAVTEPSDPALTVGLWATMHGMVMLEINHHLPFIDDRERLLVTSLRRAIRGLSS